MLASRPVHLVSFDRSWGGMPMAGQPTLLRLRDDLVIMPSDTASHLQPLTFASSTEEDNEDASTSTGASSPRELSFCTDNAEVAGPSSAVRSYLGQLAISGKPAGIQLFDHLKQAVSLLKEGVDCPVPNSDTYRLVGFVLRDVHATLLEVDDDLTDCLAPEDAETVQQCRAWLKQLQAFVMGLQRDLDSFGGSSSLDPLQQHRFWAQLVAKAHAKVAGVVEELLAEPKAQPAQQQQAPAAPMVPSSKLVCQRTTLTYNRHWANKVAL